VDPRAARGEGGVSGRPRGASSSADAASSLSSNPRPRQVRNSAACESTAWRCSRAFTAPPPARRRRGRGPGRCPTGSSAYRTSGPSQRTSSWGGSPLSGSSAGQPSQRYSRQPVSQLRSSRRISPGGSRLRPRRRRSAVADLGRGPPRALAAGLLPLLVGDDEIDASEHTVPDPPPAVRAVDVAVAARAV
jgi:hypothetical protein